MAALPALSEAEPTLVQMRARFRADKTARLEAFRAARPTAVEAIRLLQGLSAQVDATLGGLWAQSAMPAGAALVAVGGYGRGELFPYSDIDVLVLLPSRAPADAASGTAAADDDAPAAVAGFITTCWDIGLEISSSVRSVDECVADGLRDVTLQTAFLEARFLCGSRRVYDAFRHATAEAIDPKAFLHAKTVEMRQRHRKFEDTPYSLEPNCKESPGGLRDLQTVLWIARAAGLGRTWAELALGGLITPFEVRQLQRNDGLLKLIRARLHLIAGRREDRLVFDLQTAVAESFGYKAMRAMRASEVLMRRYYWAAKAVTQLNQILMLNIEERIAGSETLPMRPIDARFHDRGGLLEVVADDLYERDPQAILATFYACQHTPGITGLSARTLRALYNSRGVMDTAFRRDPANRDMFMRILKAPDGQTHAFRLMNQTSVLGRYLWVFRRIVGQMQHDLFHVYTVDQHILMVLRNARRFFVAEHAHEYPFCSQLASQFGPPWTLFLAALFHDVAKGRGGDHSELGAVEVRRFCRDHGVARDDARLVEFLVRQHLTMSRVAQKEDLSDPEVIERFAQLVGDERTLTALYLLTVADIRGTSPKVWNAWKGKLLEDLYRATLRALGGARPNLDAEVETRKIGARHALNLHSLDAGIETKLWGTLDVTYFARHDAGDIAWHARMLHEHVDPPEPVVRVRLSPLGEGLQVLVYAPDRPDVFARICGYFDGAGFNILDAKVHTTRSGYALDTFQVISPQMEEEASDGSLDAAAAVPLTGRYRDLIFLVETQVAKALADDGRLPEPSRGRMRLSRRVRSFPVVPRVTLQPDERAQRWLLGVSSADRSGLLYAIARVLARHDINLQLAKITTLGERVEDTFLIDGPALQLSRKQIEIETELLEALAA